uniref:Secreted protein n=1 Tax=Rhipicephalus zambeziensis TaxID=60191 RepID=A0A224YKR7_9ACAR
MHSFRTQLSLFFFFFFFSFYQLTGVHKNRETYPVASLLSCAFCLPAPLWQGQCVHVSCGGVWDNAFVLFLFGYLLLVKNRGIFI